VLKFALAIAVGVAVAFAWMGAWTLGLRAFGLTLPDERSDRKQHIVRMGKLRYLCIFGVLGGGFAFGLAVAAAMMIGNSASWGEATTVFLALSLLGGLFNGVRSWNQLFREEVPFPPWDRH
jgi:hypothetical protein